MNKDSLKQQCLEKIEHIETIKDKILETFKVKIELETKQDVHVHDRMAMHHFLLGYLHIFISLVEFCLSHIKDKKSGIKPNLLQCKRIIDNDHPTDHDLIDLTSKLLPLINLLRKKVLEINERNESQINPKYAEVIERLKKQQPKASLSAL